MDWYRKQNISQKEYDDAFKEENSSKKSSATKSTENTKQDENTKNIIKENKTSITLLHIQEGRVLERSSM